MARRILGGRNPGGTGEARADMRDVTRLEQGHLPTRHGTAYVLYGPYDQ